MSSICTETALAFRLGPGFWSSLPLEAAALRLAHSTDYAREIIEAAELMVPDRPRLELIAKAAMEVSLLLFVAAIDEPTAAALDAVFADFVERSVAAGGWHETSAI